VPASPLPPLPGRISMPSGAWPVRHQLFFGPGDALDDLQLEQTLRPHDLLRALDVGDAGELHHDLIVALLRDARLGHAELVDAPLDRLARLHHRLRPQVDLHVRPHREGIGAVRSGAALEVGLNLVRRLAERGVLAGRHAVHPELRGTDRHHVRRDVGRPQRIAQPF
jgi:hypothetical protein